MLSSTLLLNSGLQMQVGGNGLFQQAGDLFDSPRLNEALPYIGTGVGVFTVASLGTILAVRLWRRHQEGLPPAGMTDIPPRRMEEFFARRAKDPEPVVNLMLGFRTNEPAKKSKEKLAETRRMIADEIAELTETLAALQTSPNAKKRELVSNAIDAYRDLEVFAALRSGEKVRAREAILQDPDKVFVSVAKHLNDLNTYRSIVAVQYFRKAYAEGEGALPGEKPNMEIAASYKGMGEEAGRSEARRAIRAWQKLSPAERNVFHALRSQRRDPKRDPMVPSSFLFVYLRLRNSPEVPNEVSAQESKLVELIRAEIKHIEAARGFPEHIKDMAHAMVVLRREVARKDGIHAMPSALLMTSIKRKTDGGSPKVELKVQDRPFEVDPSDVLIVRDDEYRAGDTSWMHPSVVAAHAAAPDTEKPRLVLDLSILPAPSLGDGHKVAVDMEDRRMKEFLERLRPYRERLEKGESNAVVAGDIWRTFRSGGEKFDRERLQKAAGSGNVHSLFDLIDNTAVIERAILIQIAFQYVGIRSGLEKNEVSIISAKDNREIPMGLQLWVRMSLAPEGFKDSYVLHAQIAKPLPEREPNFARFVDQPSQAGAAPVSGRTSTSASGPRPVTSFTNSSGTSDVTPLPKPVPPSDDDDDNRPTMIPPARGSAATVLAPFPPPPPAAAGSAVDRNEQTMQINIGQMTGMAIRSELVGELRSRFRTLDSDDQETSQYVATIAKSLFEAWDKARRPATDFDSQGNPTRVSDDFFNAEMEQWLQAKEKSPFPKDREEAAALRKSDLGTRAEREGRAVRKPLSQPPTEAPKATPPPLPVGDEHLRDIRNLIFRRYPSLRDTAVTKLVGAYANILHEKGGGDPEKQMELLVAEVRKSLQPLRRVERFRDVLAGILAADGIWDELRERRRAFRDTNWSSALQDALHCIYEAWRASDRRIEVSPTKTPLIPEDIFESGYKAFFDLLQRRYPNVPAEVLKQTFMDSDEGPRAKRWEPPAKEDDAIEVQDSELVEETQAPQSAKPTEKSVAAPAPQPGTSDVSNVRVRPAAATETDISARLLERYPFFLNHIAVVRAMAANAVKTVEAGGELGQALDTELGNLFLHLANQPGLTAKQEAILKGMAEADLIRALKDNYTFFRDPKRQRAVEAQAQEIYRLWNMNNRTFDGTEKVRPLRIPERFLEQAMDTLINHFHRTDRPKADAIAGSRVDRDLRRKDSSYPTPPAAIPVSEETIYLELVDRIPEFATHKSLKDNAKFLAAAIYRAWLQKDPTRAQERRGIGLRGFVPEVVLEEKLKPFLAYLRTTKVSVTDRGTREKRGTGVLERQLQKRTAAA